MPLAPSIAASLNAGLTAPRFALYVDGLNVLRQGATGVDPRDITLTWQAAGQVSRLDFEAIDVDKLLTPREGMTVRYVDLQQDMPLFIGWIENVRNRVTGIGQTHAISCIGAEAVLDWQYVPSMTFTAAAGPSIATVLQALVAAATPIGVGLNVACVNASGSKIATPIAGLCLSVPALADITTPAGSLRRALEYAANTMMAFAVSDVDTARATAVSVTVDRWYGLRVWCPRSTGNAGIGIAGAFGDHETFNVSTVGPFYPSDPDVGYSSTDAARGVFVQGSGVSVLVSDGSGKVGRVAKISDPGTTLAQVTAAGLAYLATRGPVLTGSIRQEGTQGVGTTTNVFDCLSPLLYTDSVLGISAVTTYITQIVLTFAPSNELTWQIDFGATLASGAAYLRALTQDQLI